MRFLIALTLGLVGCSTPPLAEVCNDVDDDHDGTIDEGRGAAILCPDDRDVCVNGGCGFEAVISVEPDLCLPTGVDRLPSGLVDCTVYEDVPLGGACTAPGRSAAGTFTDADGVRWTRCLLAQVADASGVGWFYDTEPRTVARCSELSPPGQAITLTVAPMSDAVYILRCRTE